MKYPKHLAAMKKAAIQAGPILERYFKQTLKYKIKSSNSDFVTIADVSANRVIVNLLRKNFPKFGILSEETGWQKGSEGTFIVDPLDGTNNFVIGMPVFTTAISLVVNNEVVAGVVYNPVLKNLYYAEKGVGAYLNGKKRRVNAVKDIKRATLAKEQGYLYSKSQGLEAARKLTLAGCRRVLSSWSPQHDHCQLASGKIEGIFGREMQNYDYLAGVLIATEAGAKLEYAKPVKNYLKDNASYVITSTPEIMKNIYKILA